MNQFRNFTIRLYSETKQNVQNLCINFNHYAFILHDQDHYNDDTEDHAKGDLKKPHYHIVANFSVVQSKTNLLRLIDKYIPHSGAYVQPLQNAKGGFDYLTHSTEQAIKDNKHRYDPAEIVSDKPMFWHEKEVQDQIKQDKLDWTVKLFDRMIDDKPISSKEFIEFAHEFGRDYMFNFKKIYEYAEFVKGVKQHEEECKPWLQPVNDGGEENPFNPLKP